MIIYWAETYWIHKNNKILLVATEKTGREVNAEKPAHIFIFYEENVEEFHNIKLCNNFVWANFNKSKLPSQIKVGYFKLRGNLLSLSPIFFFCQIPIQEHRD